MEGRKLIKANGEKWRTNVAAGGGEWGDEEREGW